MNKRLSWLRRGCMLLLVLAGMSALLLGGGVVALVHWPGLAASGSDVLRNLIGDKPVAQIESTVFRLQDTFDRWRYNTGLAAPSAPWQTVNKTSVRALLAPSGLIGSLTGGHSLAGVLSGAQGPAPVAGSSPGAAAWSPPAATPLGSLQGVGVWTPYIQDPSGGTVAYRTFLQPDPSRPYVVVGVVAFDTSNTRLHFVLGSVEPFSPSGPKRSGMMPAQDKLPGVLLAMFNGGFKARHGQFGAMADGLVALPPRDGLATIAIYQDGSLRLGAWGSDISASPDMVAWRQNGPLVVNNGQINPRIYDNLPSDWGYTVDSVSPTWRSGIGLSADGKTLYYLCGPDLSMEMLAKAMLAAGIYNGMQLDINNYWVHFVAIRPKGGGLSLEPLFPQMMSENVDRYLGAYTRDYFYVTLANSTAAGG